MGFVRIMEFLPDDWIFTFHKLPKIKVTFRNSFQNTKGYPGLQLCLGLSFGELHCRYMSIEKILHFTVENVKTMVRVEVMLFKDRVPVYVQIV